MCFRAVGVIVESISTATNQNIGQLRDLSASKPVDAEEVKNQQAANSSRVEEESVQVRQEEADKENREGQQQDVEYAAKEIETFLQMQNRSLSFTLDDKSERSVVTVKDTESGDVIRQIPSEEVLRLAERIKSLQEDLGSSVGVLFSNRV